MATLVGTQTHFIDALKDLIELEYDAADAYEVAIKRLDSTEFRNKFEGFLADHHRHVFEISNYLTQKGVTPPTKGSLKSMLTTGKVIMANMIGDKMILSAMLSNEEDTNTAYERLTHHKEKDLQLAEILDNCLGDERRHAMWIRSIVND